MFKIVTIIKGGKVMTVAGEARDVENYALGYKCLFMRKCRELAPLLTLKGIKDVKILESYTTFRRRFS